MKAPERARARRGQARGVRRRARGPGRERTPTPTRPGRAARRRELPDVAFAHFVVAETRAGRPPPWPDRCRWRRRRRSPVRSPRRAKPAAREKLTKWGAGITLHGSILPLARALASMPDGEPNGGSPMRTLIRGALGCALVLRRGRLVGVPAPGRSAEPKRPPAAHQRRTRSRDRRRTIGGARRPRQRAAARAVRGRIPSLRRHRCAGRTAPALKAHGSCGCSTTTRSSRAPASAKTAAFTGERDYRERGMRVVAGPLTITIMQQACTASGVELPIRGARAVRRRRLSGLRAARHR